mmetsp:Transcript_11358/g.13431  ORF Transcript_11358/g.13431 Transcript_11358/m.13431 type:complete len:602 (-) Transcript_11358:412-2217(-)|eukprot:CAMPEP_0197850204 /NCGR_PEP_ID=MMETSP1438-20131217/14621_1 /TAXON_ID=1461541 /ORGANISM="Pterosperma sp., Strain CCMP1384" /LENGTH=601 /DNA_ID=CAMNT_0043463241 /DNA_START=126 /DNA_END=1931 /DNA_ORIENTATION=-
MQKKMEFVGDYDWGVLMKPWFMLSKEQRKLPFFGKNDETPLVVAAVMGLQHAFAMIGGLIVPPFVVMKFSVAFMDVDLQQYAIAASLIISGLCTILNCIQFKIPGTKFVIGTGMLSVIGTSFGFLPVFESAIAQMKADGEDPRDAYGKMLGTTMICSLLEVGLSFVPPGALKKLFPRIVTGPAVMLIGIGLTGTGMKYWGGGAVCADMAWKNHASAYNAVGFGPVMFQGTNATDTMKIPPIPGTVCAGKTCCAAGDVYLPFGSSQYVGLGFSVLCFLLLVEMVGSAFMKNCNVVLALLFGYLVAGLSEYKDNRYVVRDNIDNAPAITFLWAETFSLGVYGPAIFPMLIAFIVTTVETIGDLTATYEASEEPTDTEDFNTSIQGGLLSDGICSILSALGTGMPNTTFSQNNGVIALTKCASRRAGVCCGIWLLLMGVFAKVSGIISSIPDCVIGGMTTFLFCNVFVSGLSVTSEADLTSRRNRLILALSMGVGIGVAIVPYIVTDFRASTYWAPFWPCEGPFRMGDTCSDSEKGIRNGILIFLSTPYCIGTVLAMLLNLILPPDMIIERKQVSGGFDPETSKVEVDMAPMTNIAAPLPPAAK